MNLDDFHPHLVQMPLIFIVYTCQKEMKSIQIYKMYEIYYNKHAF